MDKNTHKITLDIEVYYIESRSLAQVRYLVHSYEDVFWTDSLDDAMGFMKQSLLKYESHRERNKNVEKATPVI